MADKPKWVGIDWASIQIQQTPDNTTSGLSLKWLGLIAGLAYASLWLIGILGGSVRF